MTEAALVLGKFYPPHAGHLNLLRAALAARASVVVLCLGGGGDSLRPQARLSALLEDAAAAGLDAHRIVGRSGFDEAPFDLGDEAVWRSHVGMFSAHLRQAPVVDLLVTSERYGEHLASYFGVEHLLVDVDRIRVPMSATLVRADPIAAWSSLGPGTRRMLAARVVIVGAESTGTTTIARLLAERLRRRGGPWAQVQWVEEYGHRLTEMKQDRVEELTGVRPLSVEWTAADFVEVVQRQCAAEEDAAGCGGPILVCDTDAFATPVWERRYRGRAARLDPSSLGRGDVYLLTHHEDVPFVQDGTRDGEAIRTTMTTQFEDALVAGQRPWAMLTGSLEQRLNLAERIADQVLLRKLSLVDPA